MSLQLDLYSKLYLARNAEEAIRKYYNEDEMKTPMHMSYGQEIAPVGVCHALTKEDQVFGFLCIHVERRNTAFVTGGLRKMFLL